MTSYAVLTRLKKSYHWIGAQFKEKQFGFFIFKRIENEGTTIENERKKSPFFVPKEKKRRDHAWNQGDKREKREKREEKK